MAHSPRKKSPNQTCSTQRKSTSSSTASSIRQPSIGGTLLIQESKSKPQPQSIEDEGESEDEYDEGESEEDESEEDDDEDDWEEDAPGLAKGDGPRFELVSRTPSKASRKATATFAQSNDDASRVRKRKLSTSVEPEEAPPHKKSQRNEYHSTSPSFDKFEKVIDQRLSHVLDKLHQLEEQINVKQTPPGTQPTESEEYEPPSASPAPSAVTSITPSHLLSCWNWVDTAHLDAIASGSFDINDFPALLHDQLSREKHLISSTYGIHTDLLDYFPDLQSFTFVFSIYAAIRTAFDKEYGPALLSFIQQITLHASRVPWPNVLNYIVAFFRTRQYGPPELWLDWDFLLITFHLILGDNDSQTQPSDSLHSTSNHQNHRTDPSLSRHLQTCIRYNRGRCHQPCGRQHRCLTCDEFGHPFMRCPTFD